MIREAALRTKGSGGPSGVDANSFKRIFTCKSFKKSSANLCDALAAMTRKLCAEYIDPRTIKQVLVNRLIPLDKGEGAGRPIGVGEVIRRVIGKCVIKVTKEDVLDASGSLGAWAKLLSMQCILYSKRKKRMPYSWLMPQMLSTHLTGLHCFTI